MGTNAYLDKMISSTNFRFERLIVRGIDNSPVFKINKPDMIEQETCLFHRDVLNGDQYFNILHTLIQDGISSRQAIPVVRFADGEYAFYHYSLHCNGLYQQAESLQSIRDAMPAHIEALKTLSHIGRFASLIHPGNVRLQKKGFFSFLRRDKEDDSALKFIDFLFDHHIKLSHGKYIPFYVVYAYLTSEKFRILMQGKKICIINSECDMEACTRWFSPLANKPDIVFTEIPDSYMATRWTSIKEDILSSIPSNIDICLVGAGVGSLLVCVDVAQRFSIPAIDAGHVLNMMNDRVDKSHGLRLFTIHKEANAAK